MSSVLDNARPTTIRISLESKLPGDSLNVCGQELVLAPGQSTLETFDHKQLSFQLQIMDVEWLEFCQKKDKNDVFMQVSV